MPDKEQSVFSRLPVIISLAFISCALWGSAAPVIKTGYSLMNISPSDTATIILYAGMRFTLAGIFAVAGGSLIMRKALIPKKSSIKNILVLAFFQTLLQYVFYYVGVAHASGVKTSIMVSTNVFFSLLLSCWVFRAEKLSLRKFMGCLVGFSGILLVNLAGSGEGMGMTFLGEGFVMLSSASYGIAACLIKNYAVDESPVTLSGWQFFAGGLIMCLIGFSLGGRVTGWDAKAILVLVYLAFLSSMAYSLWSLLLVHNPISRISVYSFLNPMCGVILSAFILNEKEQAFTWAGLISLILVCAGITIVNRAPEHSKKK